MTTAYIGQPIDRVDGLAKVTGEAKYAAEYHVPGLAYGWVVSSAAARGKIAAIDASEALNLPGVIHVFTHENTSGLAWFDRSYRDHSAPPGSPFRPLHDAEIHFSAQPIALVVAETLELARYASTLVRVEYERATHSTDLEAHLAEAYEPKERSGIKPPPKPRGRADEAFARAAVQVDAQYLAPVEHHNPMEMFATTVVRDEHGTLTVYDKTQGVQNVRNYLCNVFGFSTTELRVVSAFVGGGFGSGLRPQYQVFLAVLAARELKRSVRVCLTRQQMFSFGHRPTTRQRMALGASADGALEAVVHEAVAETSRFEDYSEEVVNWSGLLYRCDNVRLDHKVVQLDLCTPIDMRAPGAVWGLFALESAMDELAVKLGMDPIELRLKNYVEKDMNEDKPFSSKELRECYRQGAERFGWTSRDPRPGSMRRGSTRIGWGMAGGCWESTQQIASSRAVLTVDGKLTVSSATEDIGTGTYTIMTQIAAEALGLPMGDVTFKLGDSNLPEAPVQGGSFTASSVGSAVKAACDAVRKTLFGLARKVDDSPLAKAALDDVDFADGRIYLRGDPSRSVSVADAMRHGKVEAIDEEASAGPSSKQHQFSRYVHSAVFTEVEVDEDFGTVRVTRALSAVAGGRVLNPKTARSQVMGGVVWGIGSALVEASVIDHAFGRFINHNLADYHVPVNADIHDVEVIFVKERDEVVNPLGTKGLGEIGVVGVAAAVANAVFHATGKRVRELPITLDKLL
ncbi:MAG: xanthine dehydrogenase family protein molybdopterin-binding subunit [Paludisphaera borealis]|uniref:xanthine dehydrogenase family protein molybdopterin-binding subunit n=1 Tax=Paludisphaera borealis TaxID=1387353 RepID=UPI00284FCB48|nr:xanthine dehydrogenase family protein molybdopterin-binding subunit [Paludisphaera borealis]MDR3618632.1 xanthine dehydrogenase family protein molybdopterin-binding subunit [Paludisphaera borealis]